MKYQVTYKHVIERTVTAIVEADSEQEAGQKARDGDFEESDEECCPEQGLEIKDIEVIEMEDEE